ncbi:MAG: GNAT family N-acetyltransferase [Rickettsiales bacterium]|jgi:GNAT superfamily N-acetyltransferase|nr:GNAT family N-acetyltransferase [Rickettsiales bacterium]
MSESIIVRAAQQQDFQAVQVVQAQGGDALQTNGDVIEIADMEIQAASPNGIFGVAEADGKIVGFVYGEKLVARWAMASYFTVVPDFRGTDAYRRLGDWFMNQAKALGAKYVLLYADADNKRLIRFYEHFGFVQGGKYAEMVKEV